MGNPRQAFEVESRPIGDDGHRRPHLIAFCSVSDCDFEEAIPMSTHSGAVPFEVGAKMFRKRGWSMGANRSKDKCPSCAGVARVMSAPEDQRMPLIMDTVMDLTARDMGMFDDQHREEEEQIMAEAKPKKTTGKHAFWDSKTPEERSQIMKDRAAKAAATRAAKAAKTETPPPAPTPEPETPAETPSLIDALEAMGEEIAATPVENRTIRAVLDDVYDIDHQGYTLGHDDASVAESLKMPRAWVRTIREALYGPEKNAKRDALAAVVDSIRKDLSALEDEYLSTVEKFDERRKALEARLDEALKA